MVRLPVPGSDDGTWGDLLNDFLAIEHNTDGSLKVRTDGSFVTTTGAQTIAGIKTFTSSPVVPTPSSGTQAANKTYVDSVVSGGAPDATTSSKGIVQLAGDLAGTAASPTVPGKISASIATTKGDLLAATASATLARLGVGSNTQVLTADSTQSTGIKWATPTVYGTGNMNYRGAWTASTAYAVNDVVTIGGEILITATGHTSASSFALTNWTNLTAKTDIYNVMLYGAKGDGTTDDTTAINAAVSAAYSAGTSNGTYYAEIYFPPAIYLLSGATTANSTVKGNAQIPLPVVATTGKKFTMVFRGVRDGSALPHWEETVAQKSGAVLVSTIAQDVDGTFGPPSVIGGPTSAQGYGDASGTFSNLLVVIDGISVVVPADPKTMGFNFSGVAEANIISASVNGSTTPGNGLPTQPTHSWAVGVYMPQTRNNDKCFIQNISVEGMYIGMILSEHSVITNAQVVYCVVGIDILDTADYIWIGYASVELCVHAIQAEDISGGGSPKVKAVIEMLDIEINNSAGNFSYVSAINDPSNYLTGDIRVHVLSGVTDTDPTVVGGTNARIISASRRPGNVTAPSMPSSTTAQTNTFYRDAAVTVTSGTVSAVRVDGVVQGYAATGFTVIVPAGRTIALTYSVAPTWVWTLL